MRCGAITSSALLLSGLFLAAGSAAAYAQLADPPSAPQQAAGALPSLESVRWAGPAVRLQDLRGKTVVLLVYATWCPKCNEWSGEFFQQLKQAVTDKPVVVLAINADKSPQGVEQYLKQRGFFAPNIIHGYDPTIPQRLGLESELYRYFLFGPDGKLLGRGYAGTYRPVGETKSWSLPEQLANSSNLGQFTVLKAEMSETVKQLLWPMELGQFNEALLGKLRRSLKQQEQKELDEAMDRYLDAQLEQVRQLAQGDVLSRLEAFDKASQLAAIFKTHEQAREARKLIAEWTKDKDFQRELAAKRAYESSLQAVAAKPAKRESALLAVAKRFEGTWYGKKAEEEAKVKP